VQCPLPEGLQAAPANPESIGISLAQGEMIFATWFTYDTSGKAWWLTMAAEQTGPDRYAGVLYQSQGPAYNAVPFDPARVTRNEVGSATLSFSDANNGSFAYTVNGVSQVKAITRQAFGPLPVCVFGGLAELALASNYQDLWWAAPANSESGWGVNFTHRKRFSRPGSRTTSTARHYGCRRWRRNRGPGCTRGRCTGRRVRRSMQYRSIRNG
jgi:hypothetical protein